MKPISLTEEQKMGLFQKFLEKFNEELKSFAFSSSATISVKANFEKVAEEKVNIIYTPQAYLRMQALVEFFDTEVAWYGLCERLDEKNFRVYDVKVCKQYVTGAKVDTEDEDTIEFFSNLTDDEAAHMHFQAHSHVKMSTSASGTDLQNQQDVVGNMGKSGFYIFQIWNKGGDINTYLYDLDNNIFYDRKDVCIQIEDSLGTIDDFIVSISDLVTEKKYQYQYQYPKTYNPSYFQGEKKTATENENSETKEEKGNTNYPYASRYNGGYGGYSGYQGGYYD